VYDIEILAIIWISVFVASYLANKTRLTPVLWFLFCGALLVNIGIIPTKLPVFIESLSELGIIIIMFALGFEEDANNFMTSIKRSWGIALFGALVPFAVAYGIAWQYWQDANIALLCGLAMTATAVSLTMVSLKTEGLNKTPAATGIMTSAVLDDIASLVFVALLVPVATGEAAVTLQGALYIVGKAMAFFIIVALVGGWLFPAKKSFLSFVPLIGRLGLRRMLSMGRGEYTILSLLLIAALMGILAHQFGFHPAVGAYMAGLVIHRNYFDFHQDKQVDFYRQSREMIDNIAFSWIGPIFFVALGSKLVFEFDLFVEVLPGALLLFVSLFIGQVSSASLAAKYTGNFSWPDSLMIGFGMLGRAELAFVVLDIAYVQNQILSTAAFYTLMITTFLLNTSVPLCIRWWKIQFGKLVDKE
jgi:Na+:H+ antiporter